MASPRIAHQDHGVTVGVDTHGDMHVAAAFTSDLGRPLGHLEIETTPEGYRRLLAWARRLGDQPRFGIEGTGSYGAGLARFLRHDGCVVIEVNRPNRQTRHARGKSDPVDAEAAARAVLSGEATCIAKRDDDLVGMIRTLRVARRSAVKASTQTTNQIRALIVTAPAELREHLRSLSGDQLIDTAGGPAPRSHHLSGSGHQARPQGPGAPPSGASGRDRHARCRTGSSHRCRRGPAVRPARCRAGCRRRPAGRGRGQPRADAFRERLRPPLRGGASPGLVRQDHWAPSPQSRWRSPGERRPLAHRHDTPRLASAHQGLHGKTHQGGHVQEGDHPLPLYEEGVGVKG